MLAMRARVAAGKISPQVWRILLQSLIFGLAINIADLLFNFYLVSLGYTVATAGLFSTIGRAAGMVVGIPLGMMIDRVGAQRSIVIGIAAYGLGWVWMLQTGSLWLMIPIQFILGAAYILTSSAVTPLLAGVTHDQQRAMVFGWNASATFAVGLIGNALGGVLPSIAARYMHVGPQDTLAYRLALTIVIGLSFLALIPVFGRIPLITETHTGLVPLPTTRLPMRRLVRYSLAGMLLGMGGGALLPFQNLFFRDVFLMDDATVGVVLAWSAVGMGIGGLLGAPVAKRIGLRRAAALLRLGTVPAMLLMLTPSFPLTFIGFFLRGLFVAASFPLNDAFVIQATPLRQRGIATSMMTVLWSGGWAVAAWTSGLVQERWGFTPVIIFAAVTYAISTVAIITLPDSNRRSEE